MTNTTNTATLLKTVDGHVRAYPVAEVAVTSVWGAGRLVYATDDGFVGLQLDGETRIDEYPAECVKPVEL